MNGKNDDTHAFLVPTLVTENVASVGYPELVGDAKEKQRQKQKKKQIPLRGMTERKARTTTRARATAKAGWIDGIGESWVGGAYV